MAEFDDKLNSILSNPDAMAQIMQLAQSFSAEPSPPPPIQPPPPQNSVNPLSALGNLDPKLITRLLPLIQELGGSQDSNARRLLYALSPYLKPGRQQKVDRALQLARLFHVGRQFLSKWEG